MAVELEAVEVQEIRTLENGLEPYNTIVIGAGTAGVGVTIALQHAGVEDYTVSYAHLRAHATSLQLV